MERLLAEFGGLFQKFGSMNAEEISQRYREEEDRELSHFINELFHECLSTKEAMTKQEILEKDRQVYLAMARFARDYQGANPNPYIRLAFEAEFQFYRIRELKEDKTFGAQVIAEEDSCAFGKELAGHCDSIRELQRSHPLAGEDCTRDQGCVCAYRFQPLTADCCTSG